MRGTVLGHRRPIRWVTPNTRFAMNVSSNHVLAPDFGFIGASVRLFSLVMQTSVCGNQ